MPDKPNKKSLKIKLRQKIKSLRNNIPVKLQEQAAINLKNIILDYQNNIIINPNKNTNTNSNIKINIACYLSNQNELSLKYYIKHCLDYLANKINICLPILDPIEHNKLIFAKYDNNTILNPNKYNILEPDLNKNNIISPKQLDIIFMPLVAFTKSGHRLGMGGGYYDRTFAFTKKYINNNINNKYITKPILIGIAYDLQCVEHIPIEEWDVDLDAIITESQVIKLNSNIS